MQNRTCSVDGCERAMRSNSLCAMHWKRWSKTGEVGPSHSVSLLGMTTQERFHAQVEKAPDGGCWTWKSLLNGDPDEYASFDVDGKQTYVHRWSYERHVGPIPKGMQIDHLCRNRACSNPEHLEPVTPRENVLRGDTIVAINAAKTECVNGHPLSGENLYVAPTDDGRRHRSCRTCRREASRRYEAKLRMQGRKRG